MTCAACVRRVERAIAGVPGVSGAEVNLVLSRARVELDPAALDGVAAAIRDAGYEVPQDVVDGPPGVAAAHAELEDVRALRRDAAIAIVLTVPLFVLAMVHDAASVIAQMTLGTIVVLGPGRRYFVGGWTAARHASPDMNTLIALGAGAAWASSIVVASRWLARPVSAVTSPPEPRLISPSAWKVTGPRLLTSTSGARCAGAWLMTAAR